MSPYSNCCLLLLLAESISSLTLSRKTSKSAHYRGDFIIGALFSIHHQPNSSQLTCGAVRETYGIQRAEATFLTLDTINNDPRILPNITLGAEIRDSCWYSPVALQESIELIRDYITPSHRLECASNKTFTAMRNDAEFLVGVLGPGSSSVAIQVQNLLQLFDIPQVTYSATSRDLSDKSRFNTMLRVVPSDYHQAQVLVDLIKRHKWTYVSAIYTDENYGQSGMAAFRELASEAGVCIAREDSILSKASDKDFDSVIDKIRPTEKKEPEARVVVCFCEGFTIRGLLAGIQRKRLAAQMLLIGSDGWADRKDVAEGFEREAHGSISVRIHSPPVKPFRKHYTSLKPLYNTRNPWFQEFWEQKFNCSLKRENETIVNATKLCTGKESLSSGYQQDPKLNFVVRAIYAMAHGLHNMQRALCPGINGTCAKMLPFNGTLYKHFLLKVNATALDEDVVDFDENGDPPPSSSRYDIMNYQYKDGSWEYAQIGEWVGGNLTLTPFIQYSGAGNVTHDATKVYSVCSRPCAPGYYKLVSDDPKKHCCWTCIPCSKNEIQINETSCKVCKNGSYPSSNHTYCIKSPIEFLRWSDTSAIVAVNFAIFGLLMTAFTAAVFLKNNETPVVKSSTRELSYLILIAMAVCFASVFVIISKPTDIRCLLGLTIPSLSLAMMYASVFTKTNRIARILKVSKKRFPSRKLRFMSATAQVVISVCLTLMSGGVCAWGSWMWPIRTATLYPDQKRTLLVCSPPTNALLSALGPPLSLLAACAGLAVKTRSLPHNFNEAKFIGVATYTTCVICIAFFPIYFGSDTKYQTITFAICITLSATVALIFMFGPRLYIILIRPEKNTRAHFITTRSIRCHVGGEENAYMHFHGYAEMQQHRRVETRTIFCQTSSEGSPIFTEHLHRYKSSEFCELNPKSLLHHPDTCCCHNRNKSSNFIKTSPNTITFDVNQTRICEETVSNCSLVDEDANIQIKDITIRLGLINRLS